jgi:hypothetical protein
VRAGSTYVPPSIYGTYPPVVAPLPPAYVPATYGGAGLEDAAPDSLLFDQPLPAEPATFPGSARFFGPLSEGCTVR